jgi:hypothetical protein
MHLLCINATRVTPIQIINQWERKTIIKEREENSNPLRNIPTPKLESQRRKILNAITAMVSITHRMHA